MKSETHILSEERIAGAIHSLRGYRVMLDEELATLYQVQTKMLIRAVQRNIERFPDDFMFQLTLQEVADLRIHFGSSRSHGGRRYLPYAFTEQGVAMLSSVLRSPRAIQVNIEIMRTFVQLRRFALTHEDLNRKLASLEKRFGRSIRKVLEALRELMAPEGHKPTLGFARRKIS